MKEIFIKNWKPKILLGLYSSEDIPDFTNNEILEINIKYNIYNAQLWNYVKKIELLKEVHILVKALNKIDNESGDGIFGVCNKSMRKLTDTSSYLLIKEMHH